MLLAAAMAGMINNSGSKLTAESNCYSACAYMLLAAKNRHVAEDADVRIHSSFTPDGQSDFGYRWLQSIGRSDIAEKWGRSMNLHRLTAQEIM